MDTITRTIDLSNYLPPVSSDSLDIQEVMHIETIEVQALWDALCDIFTNQYIAYMTDYGLSQWETIFNITPDTDATLADRRFAIIVAIAGQRPYTYPKLEELLTGLCGKGGYTITLDTNAYKIQVLVSLGSKKQRIAVTAMLEEIIPKNLLLTIDLLYNRHVDLKRFTHGRIAALGYTHHDLREEVLADA